MRRKLPPDLLQRPLAIVWRQVAPAITRFEIPRADISGSAASRDPVVLHRPSGPPLPRATAGPRGGLPLLALLLVGPERILPLLERGKQWLFAKGDLLVGLVSVALALYLGWQGIEGLQLA